MLPETLLDQAYIVAEKIRAIIEREQMHIGQSNVNVTVSAGVSAMEPGQSYETAIELINVADKKLYRAKHSGRNLVVK
jgi:diguanylate cyclase (GGDEF)-like protein